MDINNELYLESDGNKFTDTVYTSVVSLFKKETVVSLTEVTKNVEGSAERIKELMKGGTKVSTLIANVYSKFGNDVDTVTKNKISKISFKSSGEPKVTYTRVGNRYIMTYVSGTMIVFPFRHKENDNKASYTEKGAASSYLKKMLTEIKKLNVMDEVSFKLQPADSKSPDMIGLYATFRVILGAGKNEKKDDKVAVATQKSVAPEEVKKDAPVDSEKTVKTESPLHESIYGYLFTESDDEEVNPELKSVNLEIKRLDEYRARVADAQRKYDEAEADYMRDSNAENEKRMRGWGTVLSKATKELKEVEDSLEDRKDALTEAAMILEAKRNISEEIKPIVDIFNKKGYKVKYASPGYVDERKKNDRDKDGVYYGKTYSTARIMFDGPYTLPTPPEGWHIREVDGCTYLDVNPKNVDKPDREDLQEIHDELLASLQKFAEDLEPYNSDKVSDTKEDVVGAPTNESFDFDNMIDSVEDINMDDSRYKEERAYTESMVSFIDSLDSVCL